MAKVRNTAAISRKVNRAVKDAFADDALWERIGRIAIRHIQDRTRDGVDPEGIAYLGLAVATTKRRGKLAEINKTSAYYSQNVSNLHFTGQLLRSLVAKATKRFGIFGAKRVEISVEGERKPYVTSIKTSTTKSGKKRTTKTRAASAPSNKELARYMAEAGRKFLGLDDDLRQRIREEVARHVKRFVRQAKRK